MITVLELSGTNTLFDVNGEPVVNSEQLYTLFGHFESLINYNIADLGAPNMATWGDTAFHPDLVKHILVPYSAALWPMGTSMSEATNRAITMINNIIGQFCLMGYSQGAWISSKLYDLIRTGSLSSRNTDFLGGFMMGNPRRQVGKTFPQCSDPGGAGVAFYEMLSGTESRWFEFANPGDVVCCNDHNTIGGQTLTAIAGILDQGWDGTQDVLRNLFINPVWTIIDSFEAIVTLLSDAAGGPHGQYGAVQPLAPRDTRPYVTIGVDYIHSLALGWDGATVAPNAIASAGGLATLTCNAPTEIGTYNYTIKQWNDTTKILSDATLSSPPNVSGGVMTANINNLVSGNQYIFMVELGTTYINPTVAPLSTASNKITAIA